MARRLPPNSAFVRLRRWIGLNGLQFLSLFDPMEEVQVWVKDPDGLYVWVNHAFLLHFAISKGLPSAHLSQVVAKTDYDLCPAYLADRYRADDARVLAGERIINRIELVGEHGGLATWNVTNKIPLRTETERVIGTAGMTRPLQAQDPAIPPGTKLVPVLNHIREHYCEPLANRELARLAGLSVRTFERRFMSSLQMSPQKYLRSLRLHKASHALVFSRMSIAEVAATCGFSDQSHFTREFRRRFSRTPREYRACYQQS